MMSREHTPKAISELPLLMQNPSNEDLHENDYVNRTHLYMNGFARRIV